MNLFKKAAVCTDIHFGAKTNSTQHNEDCLNFIKWFVSVAKENECDTCLFLGDWHHHRATINVKTLQYSLRALELLNESFSQTYFIVGNHDLYYRDKRDTHSIEWGNHLPNIHIVNDWLIKDDVTFAPWLIGDDWKKLSKLSGKYLFGHFELPHFFMNARVEMPDHGEIQTEHLKGFEKVFSGHFHKRQVKGNVTYIGNCFPHNYSDSGDDERGMMILEWDKSPTFLSWPNQPTYRVLNLSDVLEHPDDLLLSDSHVRVNLDIDISYEESSFIKEQLLPKYKLRELTLLPVKADITQDDTDYTNLHFDSVDSIIQEQIGQLQDGSFNRQLLLEIYQSL